MKPTKKNYVKPEISIVEVKMDPLLQSSYGLNDDPWYGPFN